MQDENVQTPWTAAEVKRYHFRSLLLRRELHPPRNNDGITIRTWRLLGWGLVPGGLHLHVATIAPQAEFGRRGARAPGTWKRLLRLLWQDTGWTRHVYCPDRPPHRVALNLRLPCLQLSLHWSAFRPQARVEGAHYRAPCAACEADGRRPPAERDAT
ncbi:hypothetical protein SEA_GILGAMESH_150 [Streptomyces phage Gilgamesh]|uniref:Uncharacterized protein n=1 Tax=Streptomyces phage Gilgamesh TaxID=2599890 RepID=A0A5J6TY73_9CAUD|nr:hypothetical protein QEH35_gp150 [Streptomyces phage Gilgamesh]QFG13342.1 hypothetical protein SEA_GILGAMESH_150 [Streptomyces phage Gilgamesh]